MDFKTARVAMVESQIRPNGVRNTGLLNAFADIPRELFVPERLKPLVYAERALRIDSGTTGRSPRFLLAPMTLAKLIEYAEPKERDVSLDVGGLSGYSAAILSKVCKRVFMLEETAEWADLSAVSLKAAGIEGILPALGPLPDGLRANAPYDIILVNGAVAAEPRHLCEQLSEGGRLVTIVGNRFAGQAHMFTKTNGGISGRAIFDAAAAILPAFEPDPVFVF